MAVELPPRAADYNIVGYRFWWREMVMQDPYLHGYRLVYSDRYIFWLDSNQIKRGFFSAELPIKAPDGMMETVAMKYRSYIAGLILGDPLMKRVTTARISRR